WEKRGEQLSRYLKRGVHAELQQGAISGLADVRSPKVGPALLSGLAHYSPGNRNFALDALLRDDSRVAALLDAVEKKQVKPADLAEAGVKRLLNLGNPELRGRARRLLSP